jgi:hypothetical protein
MLRNFGMALTYDAAKLLKSLCTGNGTDFSPSTSLFPRQYFPINALFSFTSLSPMIRMISEMEIFLK